jgi:hypothetical protein
MRPTLQQANEMIRFADVKAAAVLAAAGVLTGQLPSAHGSWAKALLLVAGVAIALSALLALSTLAPRRETTAGQSLHYYEDVVRRYGHDRNAFVDAWIQAAADEGAVAGQIWAANMVAYRKFTRITWSIRALGVGVMFLAVLSVLPGA